MSKLTRKSAQVFGSTAAAQQIAQFGSLAASAVQYSVDPAVIQSLANWKTGWFGATVGGNSPAIEDENAVDYVHSYQIGYLMQTGIPEYDAGTTYFSGSMVQDGNGNLRVSKTDSNTGNGNLLTDGTNWRTPAGHVPVGAVVATFPNLTGAYSTAATTTADASGWVLCGGQTIADATSPMNGQVVPNINNNLFLRGNTTGGTTAGAATVTLASANLPTHTHTFTSTTSVAAASHTHNMSHYHQWGYSSGNPDNLYGLSSGSTATGAFTTGSIQIYQSSSPTLSGAGSAPAFTASYTGGLFTSGALAQPNGSGSSAATGTESADTTVSGTTDNGGFANSAFSILPPYINAVYLMRIK